MGKREVERLATLGEECLRDILEEYRWAYNVGHGAGQHGEVTVKGGTSDPTGGAATAGDRARIRRALVRGEKELGEAVGILRSVRYTMDRAIRDREAEPGVMGKALVTRAELSGARDAKLRRESRGEGWGDG